jgi:hypothetical protein
MVASVRMRLIVGLHDHDPAFREISLSEDIKKITRDIGFRDPRMLQSMIICKQPEIGGSGMQLDRCANDSSESSGFCVSIY